MYGDNGGASNEHPVPELCGSHLSGPPYMGVMTWQGRRIS